MAEDGESGPGGCVGKTPVSLLQELYVRRGMVPKVMNEFSFFCLDPRSVFRQEIFGTRLYNGLAVNLCKTNIPIMIYA